MLSNNEQNERKSRMAALAGTILFHAAIIGAMLLLAFHTSLPLPGEEGVEVNLNYSNSVKGDKPKENAIVPYVSDPGKQKKTDEEILTESNKETTLLSKNKTNARKSIPGKSRKSIVETPEESTIIHKVLSVNSSKLKGNKHEIPDKAGNQGNPTRTQESQNHEDKFGNGNSISFDLGGRKARILPKPSFNSSEDGKIVVSVKVNVEGKVISATAGDKGTTITEPNMRKQAENAARISLFERDNNAPEAQRGTITYTISKQK